MVGALSRAAVGAGCAAVLAALLRASWHSVQPARGRAASSRLQLMVPAPDAAPAAPADAPSLRQVGIALGNDKVAVHRYDWIYERHLAHRRAQPLRVLEIGLGCTEKQSKINGGPGSSVRLWGLYLPRARLVELEYDADCAAAFRATAAQQRLGPPGGSLHVITGDQSNASDLLRAAELLGGALDAVIDDGSHFSPHQLATWRYVFPNLMAPGGVYFAEDLQSSFWRTWVRSSEPFAAHLSRAVLPELHAPSGAAHLARVDCAHWICAMTRANGTAPGCGGWPPAVMRLAQGGAARLRAAVIGTREERPAPPACRLPPVEVVVVSGGDCGAAPPPGAADQPPLDLVVDSGHPAPSPRCWAALWPRLRPGGVYVWEGLRASFAAAAPAAAWLATRVAVELHLSPSAAAVLPSGEPLRQWPLSPRKSRDRRTVDAAHCSALWQLDCVPGSCAAVRRPLDAPPLRPDHCGRGLHRPAAS
eukprot:TRINITY_DN38133_c0_g1_i1.p2 TRINITY_DN38133_c0_g1~~TRINITY_DN38133_c0_g1_i1.p2  ORF type:complete len:476 (+),score=116.16 TRINITY_DN38133_c0_g1_i1:74-1501(+)